MKPSEASAIVLLVQTFAQIERGEVGTNHREARHAACQRFRDNVRDDPPTIDRVGRPGGARPMVDALLTTALEMMDEVQNLDITEDTYLDILDRARARLYERIDTGNTTPQISGRLL